jgi:hypothetical protein
MIARLADLREFDALREHFAHQREEEISTPRPQVVLARRSITTESSGNG